MAKKAQTYATIDDLPAEEGAYDMDDGSLSVVWFEDNGTQRVTRSWHE